MGMATLPVSAQEAADSAHSAQTQEQVKAIEQVIEELKNYPPPAPPSDRLEPPAPPPIMIPPPPADILEESKGSPPRLVSFEVLDLKPSDYPPEAWVANEEGTARFELAVSKEGKPTGCTILETSGFELLDAQTCAIAMERAEFEPAVNAEGEAVAGYHRDYHAWSKREPQFGANTVVDVSFTVTEEGEILNCEVHEMTGELSEDMRKSFEREPCPGINSRPRAVYRDEGGNPVAKQVRLKVVVDVADLALPE